MKEYSKGWFASAGAWLTKGTPSMSAGTFWPWKWSV
jgi:hypothetical protein